MSDTQYFVRIAGDNLFHEWLTKERASLVKQLAGSEGTALHRAQGKYQILEEIQKHLEAAKKLR